SHKHNIERIADRLPMDVEVYSEMSYLHGALQKAIDNQRATNLFIWVKSPEGKMLAQSRNFAENGDRFILISMTEMPLKPVIYPIDRRYFVLCRGPLKVKGTLIGHLYMAKDITRDQQMLITMAISLILASILAIILMTGAIALYIKNSLIPLRHLSQLADTVKADGLQQATMHLDRAPAEVKELAKTLDTMLIRLSESWAGQRQFVSNVSHELRTPLTIVSGYLESTLRRGSNLTSPQREALEIASSEAQRTILLLQDLLELARADSGQIHFRLEGVVLNKLVGEVVEMAKQFSDREIVFQISKNYQPIQFKAGEFREFQPTNCLAIDEIEVIADANRLKQVLLNLIDNAVKYSDAGSPVTVVLDTKEDKGIIEVCDRGSGIPLSQQTRIFERFYRIDEARNRATGGAGLGLSIVKSLVEGMGGSVIVRSKLNEGSVFTVILPSKSRRKNRKTGASQF
ncbi:MAG: HAMP domain-containing histidine kinase, partial [Okeania sp. SIO2H7]|nr:HAMP domain-containing histidine kinase [Okeania sp. SIO2H7]